MAAHREYMDRYRQSVFFSGPMMAREGGTVPVGSLFILNASTEVMEQFLAEEPFGKAGIFQNVAVTRLRPGRFDPSLSGMEPPASLPLT